MNIHLHDPLAYIEIPKGHLPEHDPDELMKRLRSKKGDKPIKAVVFPQNLRNTMLGIMAYRELIIGNKPNKWDIRFMFSTDFETYILIF